MDTETTPNQTNASQRELGKNAKRTGLYALNGNGLLRACSVGCVRHTERTSR